MKKNASTLTVLFEISYTTPPEFLISSLQPLWLITQLFPSLTLTFGDALRGTQNGGN